MSNWALCHLGVNDVYEGLTVDMTEQYKRAAADFPPWR